MTLDERLEAAAKALWEYVMGDAECADWDGDHPSGNWVRSRYRLKVRAAIAAFQQDAPEVEVPVFKDYILECVADIAIKDLEPMHRVRLKKGTYVLLPRIEKGG